MNFQETRNNFRQKKVSAKELTEESLKKAKERDDLNAFISHFEEYALDRASKIDVNFDEFKDKPLGGIPIAHKDIFCTDGKKLHVHQKC